MRFVRWSCTFGFRLSALEDLGGEACFPQPNQAATVRARTTRLSHNFRTTTTNTCYITYYCGTALLELASSTERLQYIQHRRRRQGQMDGGCFGNNKCTNI